ncbi:hypothetical protein BDW59DRAFT_162345 [Aspergillus cavernicola]|uniref:F-box domain-containing protein n=1 Tax=Aspergillus cavernicola TaxID=176166 RepID=A0ABR4I9M3_9EURO
MASITSLIPELLDMICLLLEPQDLHSLRLTCSNLASNTYHCFADRAFSDIYLALTSDGLQFLKELAAHEVFRTYVKALWILPDLFGGEYDWTIENIQRVILENQIRESRRDLPGPSIPQLGMQICSGRPAPPPPPPCVGCGPPPPPRAHPPPPAFWGLFGPPPPSRPSRTPPRPPPPPSAADIDPIPIKRQNEDQYRTYKQAILNHFQLLFSSPCLLQDTLTSCLPCFPNLRAIGLRNYTDHAPIIARGIRTLRSQLRFNPIDHHNLPRSTSTSRNDIRQIRFKTSVFQSHVFATLMAAISITSTPIEIETLEAGGLIVDDRLPSFLPILHHLRHVTLIICSSHSQEAQQRQLQSTEYRLGSVLREYPAWKQKAKRDGDQQLLPILASAASGLESLSLSIRFAGFKSIRALCDKKAGLSLADTHFNWMAHHVCFESLRELSLSNVVTTMPLFKAFMSTTQPTLRKLSLQYMCWTSDHVFDHSKKRERDHLEVAEEAMRVFQLVCTFLRDCFLLLRLHLRTMTYQGREIRFRDQGDVGVIYEEQQSAIAFKDWIDQLVTKAQLVRYI